MAKQTAVTEAQLKAALEPMLEEMKTLRKIIIGNGTAGLDELVRSNKRDIDRHEEQLRQITSLGEQVRMIERQIGYMMRATQFILTIGGGYVIVEIVKFILNNI